MAGIPAEAQRIIDRLAALDVEHPRIDRAAVEAAFADHFRLRGVRPLPVRWMRDAVEGAAAGQAAAASGSLSAGAVWPTSEHYFQAQKFLDEELRERIRAAKSPGEAAGIARGKAKLRREDWYRIRDDVMLRVIRTKFSQHPEFRELLLSTGDQELVEHTRNDDYWGEGGDGSGSNMLGRILMTVRAELAKSE